MARFYRRYRRYRPRRYVRRWFRRRFRRYVNGSSKSTVRLKVPVSQVMSFPITVVDDGQGHISVTPSPAALITPWMPVSQAGAVPVCNVLSSPLYQAYCNLYEEVKCVGMKAQFSVSTQIGGSVLPSLEIQTSFDRRLCRNDAVNPPTYANMKTYSTFNSAIAINNSIAKLSRSAYASDLMEKASWHDCTISDQGIDAAYSGTQNNVPFFSPGLWIAMTSPTPPVATLSVSVSVEVMFYFAFRNPKFGGTTSGSNKLLDLGDLRLMDEGGNVDGDAMDDDPFARMDAAPPANLQAEQPAPAPAPPPVDPAAQKRVLVEAANRAAHRDKRMDAARKARNQTVSPGYIQKNV